MPNHIHAILIINNSNVVDAENLNDGDAINCVCTGGGGIRWNKNSMLSDGLSRIIRWYKGRVSFESRKIHADFAWHTRFFDHIIRDDEALINPNRTDAIYRVSLHRIHR